ncbi:MAG: hypothetical protein AAF799_03440 [Myxococcota bacterium]
MKTTLPWLLLAVLGCSPSDVEDLDPDAIPQTDGSVVPPGWRAPASACQLDPPDPTRLILTTTDFATGAVSVIDLDSGVTETDVAVGSTDAIPHPHGETVVVVHRHRIDRLDVLSTDDWSLRAQQPITSPTGSPNPHGVAHDASGRVYVTTFAEPELRILDVGAPPADAEQGRIDLSAFDERDGNPESSLIVACGRLMMVFAQRLDVGFRPVDTGALIVVDSDAGEALDLDPATEEPEPLPLLGGWVRQLRVDPMDAKRQTLLGLSTGIERIELSTGIRRWALPPEAMAEAGIGDRLQPQAFDVDASGTVAYLAAYDPDFSQIRLYRAGLDGAEPRAPEPFSDGYDSVERTLEVVGDRLWYGSTRRGEPGLWLFDLNADPPAVLAGPVPTGLPPYSMAAMQ